MLPLFFTFFARKNTILKSLITQTVSALSVNLQKHSLFAHTRNLLTPPYQIHFHTYIYSGTHSHSLLYIYDTHARLTSMRECVRLCWLAEENEEEEVVLGVPGLVEGLGGDRHPCPWHCRSIRIQRVVQNAPNSTFVPFLKPTITPYRLQSKDPRKDQRKIIFFILFSF